MTFRGHLGNLDLLMRGGHPEIGRTGQVRAARARPPREMRDRAIGILASGQVRARRPRLLAGVPPVPLTPLRPGRRGTAGLVIQRRRQRGTARVPRRRPLQPASRSSSSATRSSSTAFSATSSAMSWPCSAISASRAASSGLALTGHRHPGTSSVIKPARWAGYQEHTHLMLHRRLPGRPEITRRVIRLAAPGQEQQAVQHDRMRVMARGPECLRSPGRTPWCRTPDE
jgi:hypothetical protein